MSKVKQESQEKAVEVPVSDYHHSFNFEVWAKEVRPQLLAALQKRSAK